MPRRAFGGRAHDWLGADTAAGARPFLDDEWLAEPRLQPLTYQPRGDVTRATGCGRHDQAHRPRRIGLRPLRFAIPPGARQRPLPHVEIAGAEVLFRSP